MKKIFTLFAVAAMALTASAQEAETILLTHGTAEQTSANQTDIWSGAGVAADGLTWAENNISLYLVKEDKTFSGGNSNDECGKPIKFSNGAPSLLVIPSTFPVDKIEFIGYCNDKNDANTSWVATLGVEENGAYKELYTNDGSVFCKNMYSKKEDWKAMTVAEMPTITVTLPSAITGNIWFKNGGKQPCWFIKLHKAAGGTSAITDINVDENAPVEYFNLQGMRVENPANGLFIKRQGNKATKVIM